MLFFIIFHLTNETVFAQNECSKAEIKTENMPKNNNQKDLSWCFAWSSADLISFYEKKAFSSYDIAVKYHDRYPDNKENIKFTELGGAIDTALVMLSNEQALCLEKDTNYTNGDWEKLSQLFNELNDENIELKEIICQESLHNLAPIKNLAQEVFNTLSRLPTNQRLAAVIDLTCNKRQSIIGKYNVHTFKAPYQNSDQLLSELDSTLNKNEPVSIGFDIDQVLKMPDDESSPYPHASTVIGRRLNPITNKCEYLIKNSWGNECPKKSKIECIDGNLWIEKNILKDSLSAVSFMSTKSK